MLLDCRAASRLAMTKAQVSLRGVRSHVSLRGATRRSNLAGFTLVEVLIALVILAIAMTAVMFLLHSSTRKTEMIKSKLAANQVAAIVINQMHLGLLNPPNSDRTVSGKQSLLDQTWRWQAKVSENSNQYYERITVTVFQRGQWLVHRDGFIWRVKQ